MFDLLQLRYARLLWIGFAILASSCQQMPTAQTDGGGARSAAQLGQLQAQPLPNNPRYARAAQHCIFFVPDAQDGAMVPVGILKRDAYVVVHVVDEAWTDIQLTSGHHGSVITSNLESISEAEKVSRDYLKEQPDLEPLALPQASNGSGPVIDPTLLGG